MTVTVTQMCPHRARLNEVLESDSFLFHPVGDSYTFITRRNVDDLRARILPQLTEPVRHVPTSPDTLRLSGPPDAIADLISRSIA